MPCVRVKPGVTFDGLKPAGVRLLAAIDRMSQILVRDLMITCGTDSHPAMDPHTRGEAVDVRTSDLPPAVILTLVNGLTKLLGPDFTVLYETPVKKTDVLASIAYFNPQATGEHLHLQLRKNYGPWPPTEPSTTGPTL